MKFPHVILEYWKMQYLFKSVIWWIWEGRPRPRRLWDQRASTGAQGGRQHCGRPGRMTNTLQSVTARPRPAWNWMRCRLTESFVISVAFRMKRAGVSHIVNDHRLWRTPAERCCGMRRGKLYRKLHKLSTDKYKCPLCTVLGTHCVRRTRSVQ